MSQTLILLTDKPEPFRLERLSRVVGHIMRGNHPGILGWILALHNHKGLLSVNWRTRPMPSAIAAVADAWAKEHEHISNHYVRSRPLLGDIDELKWPGACENLHRTVNVDQLVEFARR